jgi:hypothetical protein
MYSLQQQDDFWRLIKAWFDKIIQLKHNNKILKPTVHVDTMIATGNG